MWLLLSTWLARDTGTIVVTSVEWELSLPRATKSHAHPPPIRSHFSLLLCFLVCLLFPPPLSAPAVPPPEITAFLISPGASGTSWLAPKEDSPGAHFQRPPHFPLLQPHIPGPPTTYKGHMSCLQLPEPAGSLEYYSHPPQSLHP